MPPACALIETFHNGWGCLFIDSIGNISAKLQPWCGVFDAVSRKRQEMTKRLKLASTALVLMLAARGPADRTCTQRSRSQPLAASFEHSAVAGVEAPREPAGADR